MVTKESPEDAHFKVDRLRSRPLGHTLLLILGDGTRIDIDQQRAAVASLRKGVEDLDRRQGYRGHVREVDKEGLEEAILGLVEENGFASSAEEGSAEEGNAEEGVDLLARVQERLAEAAPLLGVITSVDAEAKLARIALSPGVSGITHLEDVSWARPADPKVRSHPLAQIRTVFVTFFPKTLAGLIPLESYLEWCPLGGQYATIAHKAG